MMKLQIAGLIRWRNQSRSFLTCHIDCDLSERSLRPIILKMKITGQFESEDTAQHYAMIRSYIETCRRKGKNENEALRRLSEGNPYTVEELFS